MTLGERRRIRSEARAPGDGRRRAILEERAARLAKRGGAPAAERPAGRVLVCAVGENLFGFPLGEVAKVTRLERWAAAPAQHPALLGLVAWEGRIRPAFDLAALLGVRHPQAQRSGWVVVLASPQRAALLVQELPVAADALTLAGDSSRARVLEGDHKDKILVILSAATLMAADLSTSHGADAR